MKRLLMLNTIGLGLAIISIIILFILLMRSEKKLAKYDESWAFKKVEKKK